MTKINPATATDTDDGITWNSDGTATVRLAQGIVVDGTSCAALTLRCPSLDDLELFERGQKGRSDAEHERHIMATLCGAAPDELGPLAVPDYRRLQKACSAFFAGTAPNFALSPAG